MIKRKHIRRYRFDDEELNRLLELKKKHIVESDFVRMAIEEKFARDFPTSKLNYKSPI